MLEREEKQTLHDPVSKYALNMTWSFEATSLFFSQSYLLPPHLSSRHDNRIRT